MTQCSEIHSIQKTKLHRSMHGSSHPHPAKRGWEQAKGPEIKMHESCNHSEENANRVGNHWAEGMPHLQL